MISTPIRRTYSDFRGVDFANDPSLVLLSRSPDSLNVWKNYKDTQGSCIETRPGYKMLSMWAGNIHGMYFYNNKVLVHAGRTLCLWNNFPDVPTPIGSMEIIKSNMNDAKSTFVIFKEKLYIVDGANYLVYDGTTLKNVSDDDAYIPTTTISRSPSGGGEPYQDVNVLQPKRINSFVADGTSTEYYLDTMDITAVTKVTVNDVEMSSGYTVSEAAGKVTFTTAPAAPTLSGTDNVVIEFTKEVTGYTDRISKCTKMVVFDRRLFFAGNPDYPNAVFHSQLNTPNYVSDLAYYQDGTEESAIKSLVVGNNILWVFKEPSQEKDTIFYHTATTDTYGRVYPNFQGNVSVGCYAEAINYKDDIVFLNRTGLEGISSNDITSQQLLSHKSSLVDNKLINEEDLDKAIMTEWNGYLLICIKNHIYLGDIRQLWQSVNGYEYEWYYWDLGIEITTIKEYKGNLYIGDKNGFFYILEGVNDNIDESHTALESGESTNSIVIEDLYNANALDIQIGDYIRIGKSPLDDSIAKHRQVTSMILRANETEVLFDGDPVDITVGDYICKEGGIINSYWTTPMDNFGYGNKYKTTNKRGGVAKIKTIPNGKVKVAERTNKSTIDKNIKEYASSGFDYGDFDYSNFAYTTTQNSNVVYKIKEKKWVELQLKFYSDELDKPFGIYGSIIEAFVGGYVKR